MGVFNLIWALMTEELILLLSLLKKKHVSEDISLDALFKMFNIVLTLS